MSHQEHRGWGRFPSSNIITVSLTCQWRKCNLISVYVFARPWHPSTGQFIEPPMVVKAVLYVCGSLPGVVVSHFRLPPSFLPCSVFLCNSSDPTIIYYLNSEHFTLNICLSWYDTPSPVIRRSYAASDWVPASWYGWHTIPTVFPISVCSPNRSNIPIRVSNAPCSPFLIDKLVVNSTSFLFPHSCLRWNDYCD